MLDKKSERNFERALLHEMEKIKKLHASGTITILRATEIIVVVNLSQRVSPRLQYCA